MLRGTIRTALNRRLMSKNFKINQNGLGGLLIANSSFNVNPNLKQSAKFIISSLEDEQRENFNQISKGSVFFTRFHSFVILIFSLNPFKK